MRTKKRTIVAFDPSILRSDGKQILTTEIDVPAEALAPGPRGYRVTVIDYDASSGKLYAAWEPDHDGAYADKSKEDLLRDPRFHAQNVYAIVMRTLARFEFALGRRLAWGFDGQQIKIAPHAFAVANAFYSRQDQALLFGYYPGSDGGIIFTCLAHDIIVHETTHAILDGLRERYLDVSYPDQQAFHEGFADVVALLSTFSLRDVVAQAFADKGPAIPRDALEIDALRRSMLFALGREVGVELTKARRDALRRDALRRSVELPPSKGLKDRSEYHEPHRRGEILVAAVMNAFLGAWRARLQTLGEREPGRLDRDRVIEEGADAANCLLTMAIRALDYAPPVDLRFDDYLSALLTSDAELRPDDTKYCYREHLRTWFDAYGIEPPEGTKGGLWERAPADLSYEGIHVDALQRNREEVFRFLWENRGALQLDEDAYSRVLSVRPSVRVAPDGFVLRETVAEYKQVLHLPAGKLPDPIRAPAGVPKKQEVAVHGGGVLIFDEFGRLKYHIYQRLRSDRQTARLEFLWRAGALRTPSMPARQPSPAARLHHHRAQDAMMASLLEVEP